MINHCKPVYCCVKVSSLELMNPGIDEGTEHPCCCCVVYTLLNVTIKCTVRDAKRNSSSIKLMNSWRRTGHKCKGLVRSLLAIW